MHWQRPKQWQHIGKQFQIACVSWESRATRIPLSPPALPCPFCQTVTHFTISFNALENRIRAQARAGISHPKKWVCVCLSVLCPAKPSSVFHSKVCRCARFDTFSVALSLSQNTALPSLSSFSCCSSSCWALECQYTYRRQAGHANMLECAVGSLSTINNWSERPDWRAHSGAGYSVYSVQWERHANK